MREIQGFLDSLRSLGMTLLNNALAWNSGFLRFVF